MWRKKAEKMDRRGPERVDWSRGEGKVNVTKRGQAVTEVSRDQSRILTATEMFLSTWTNLAAFSGFWEPFWMNRYHFQTRWAQSWRRLHGQTVRKETIQTVNENKRTSQRKENWTKRITTHDKERKERKGFKSTGQHYFSCPMQVTNNGRMD